MDNVISITINLSAEQIAVGAGLALAFFIIYTILKDATSIK